MSAQEAHEDYVSHNENAPEGTGLKLDGLRAGLLEEKTLPDGIGVVSVQVRATSAQRRLRVNVSKRAGFTDAEVIRHKEAVALVEVIVNSAEFKKRVLKKEFTLNRGRTSQQIYEHMMTGEEDLQPGVDYEMDADIIMYEKRNSTVGYTYPNVTTTWINRLYFKSYELGDIGRNFIHEWTHKLGYSDKGDSRARRSVPYAVGDLMSALIREYMDGARWEDLHPESSSADA